MIGILFATETEARPFLEQGIPEGVVVEVAPAMGMESARIATEKLIHEYGCTLIINAGVCGALNNRLKRGSVFRISEVSSESGIDCVKVDHDSNHKRLVSVEQPVFESKRRQKLSAYAELVDMEGYAVARRCQDYKVPCVLFKGVTDFGDHNGKEDIQKHIDSVSESVAEVLREFIENHEQDSLLKRLHSFTKIEHTIFSLPLLFAGAWIGAEGMPSIKVLLLIVLVGVGARTFGMAVNRILDRDIDAENPRTRERELPSGKLSLIQGLSVALFGLLIYFSGCALLGPLVLKLSLLPLIPLAFYSLLKRFTPLCHYGIGVCLAAAPMGAYVAVVNSLSFPADLLLLALFTFCWISGFDIIYALMDIEFDRANNVRSIPAALGVSGAQIVAAITHLIGLAALMLLWMSAGGMLSLIALLISAAAFCVAYLQNIPVSIRFFPVSAIAGIAGALVVLFGAG